MKYFQRENVWQKKITKTIGNLQKRIAQNAGEQVSNENFVLFNFYPLCIKNSDKALSQTDANFFNFFTEFIQLSDKTNKSKAGTNDEYSCLRYFVWIFCIKIGERSREERENEYALNKYERLKEHSDKL